METNEKEIPEIFLVLRFGKNVFTKNGETSQFDVAEADVDAIIREFEERKRDLVIDYEHRSTVLTPCDNRVLVPDVVAGS